MERRLCAFLFAVLLLALALQAREVVFIGLTGESAPGMQVNFSRVLQGQLESATGIHVVNNPETERLRLQLGGLSYPAITASLASSLRRCTGDSAFVVWGLVKDVSFKIERKKFVKKQYSGHLRLELAVYDPLTQSYAYSGEVSASLVVDKGYTTEFGDLGRTDQLPVMERERLLDSLQSQVAAKSVAILVKTVQSAHAAGADSARADQPALAATADSTKSGKPAGAPPSGVHPARDSSIATRAGK